MIGKLHSVESFGAVDGPGIRFVAFLQGCPLRCLFCHNADTWSIDGGKEISAEDLIKEIASYKNFISSGGVTLSGGEPLMQAEFCEEVIDLCHNENLHVAIDTSGAIPIAISQNAILKADLIILDIKDIDPEGCRILTGVDNENALKTLNFCEENEKSVWIRQVLIPQYTMNDEKLNRLGSFLKRFTCIEKVEILPYHTLGKHKWEMLGIPYKLEVINPPDKNQTQNAERILKSYGLNI